MPILKLDPITKAKLRQLKCQIDCSNVERKYKRKDEVRVVQNKTKRMGEGKISSSILDNK